MKMYAFCLIFILGACGISKPSYKKYSSDAETGGTTTPTDNSTAKKDAANLAAFHSKAKHQSLVQVIYTPRKYVSKPKKALPGEVNVLQESFIDVEPKDFQ